MITAMDVVAHPERDQTWDAAARSETKTQRLDRNWISLLQELRVVQTGVQLLTGFLLTLPFQQCFDQLDAPMRAVYLATVGCSIAATALLVAPVGIHRFLFRRHRLQSLVLAAHRFAYARLSLLGLALTGMTVITFGTVASLAAGVIAGVCAFALLVVFWGALPLWLRNRARPPTQ